MSEWELETDAIDRHEHVRVPHLRIYRPRWAEKDGRAAAVYLTKSAHAAIGSPDRVQIMFSNAAGLYRIRLVPSSADKSRPLRSKQSGIVEMGGGPAMVRKHGFPKGYYILEDGIFVWRFS